MNPDRSFGFILHPSSFILPKVQVVMANEWHFTLNGQQAASPVTAAQLKQLAASGQLQPTDMVWQEGMANWVPASSIKGLFGGKSANEASGERPAASRSSRSRSESSAEARAESGGLLDMNPILVLVLSTCTGGLFGLFYAFKVCTNYSALAAKRDTDSAGRKLGHARHPLWVLLLTYLTLGFYFYYWVYAVMRECSTYTGRRDFNPRTEFALMLVIPLYAVYLAVFRLPDMIKRTQAVANVPETAAVSHTYVFLNPLMFCAMPFLAMLYQDALNQVWFSAS
jgi:hypothetical protein